MSKAILVMTAIATLGAIAMASIAGATGPAPYNVPKQTSKLTVGLATAFEQCTAPTLSHRPALALPACSPIQSTTMGLNGNTDVYGFGTKNGNPDGSATVTLQATTGDVKLQTKTKSIFKNGTPLTSSPGPVPPDDRPVMTALLRVTDTGCLDPVNPTVACTILEFPFPARLNCTAGSCSPASVSANGVVCCGAIHAGDTSNIEIGQISLTEPGATPDTIFRAGVLVK